MESFDFICIVVLFAFAILVGGIVMLVSIANLRTRITKLEELVRQAVVPATLTSEPQKTVSTPPIARPLPTIEPARPIVRGETSADKLVAWVREDWLLKVGAFLLLVGFSWLTTYAFLNNWIGPMGRITLGLIAGTLFIILGWWRIQKFIHQGGVFLVLGSTTILITIWAAREIYHFFTPLSALVIMFLSTAFVAMASVKYNSRTLALSSIILAGIAPVLTAAPRSDDVALFTYLLVVTLGTIWIVFLTGRRELTAAALALVTIYSLPAFGYSWRDSSHLLPFAFAFSGIFFITNAVGIIKSKSQRSVADLITAAGNGLFLLIWIMTNAPDEWKSLIICAWMIAFVAGAFLLSRVSGRKDPFLVYAGIGITMLAAATAAELEGASLTIAYTLECAIISIVAYYVRRDIRLSQYLSLLLIGPIDLSFASMFSDSWAVSVFNRDFFVLAILALTLCGLGLFFRYLSIHKAEKDFVELRISLIFGGTIIAYILLWLSLHAAIDVADTAVTTFLIILTLIGLTNYLFGRARERKVYSVYGGLLLGFVVLRLVFIDVWKMELTGRIVTFFLIGALLMSTAFLVRRKPAPEAKNNNESKSI